MSMTPRGYERFSTLSDPQQQLFESLLGRLQGQLGGEGAEKFAAPYQRQFEERIVPGLAERFAGLGAGSQSSSAFQQALGGAGADLQERLAALGGQREQNALSQLLQLLGMSTEGLIPKAKPWWQELLTGLSGGIGQTIGTTGGSLLGKLLGGF